MFTRVKEPTVVMRSGGSLYPNQKISIRLMIIHLVNKKLIYCLKGDSQMSAWIESFKRAKACGHGKT